MKQKTRTIWFLFGLVSIFPSAAAWSENFAADPVLVSSHVQKLLPAGRSLSASLLNHRLNPKRLVLLSNSAVVYDKELKRVLYRKNSYKRRPIASITKLMTAMVILDSHLSLKTPIRIRNADKDRLRHSRSRLKTGQVFRRLDLLKLALAVSENRAASALARTYPGGKRAFIRNMNIKARKIGMRKSNFADATGLHKENVSTAFDLVKLVNAADRYPLIRKLTTAKYSRVYDRRTGKFMGIGNTNKLLRFNEWNIRLSKTGFTNDSGYCLTMVSTFAGRPVTMVFLNSEEKSSRFGDANRTRRWINKVYRKNLNQRT